MKRRFRIPLFDPKVPTNINLDVHRDLRPVGGGSWPDRIITVFSSVFLWAVAVSLLLTVLYVLYLAF